MKQEKLSFADFKAKHLRISVPEQLVQDLKTYHNIDAHQEADRVAQDMYKDYSKCLNEE